MSGAAKGRRTIYVLRMSDHALTVAAAMRSQGLQAEVLPPPDDESLGLGVEHCRGGECLPCLLTSGDMLRKCREPGFDPDASALFMPTGGGPCRFGQYSILQRRILAAEGFGDVPLLTTTSEDSYSLFGDDPVRLRKLAWQALVAVDLLAKVLHERRPYEVVPGSCGTAYEESLDALVAAVETGSTRSIVQALRGAANRFAAVEVDRTESKPLVAILGEIYVMLNVKANLDLVGSVEAAGGEVFLGTFMDWLYFVDWRRRDLARRFGRYREAVDAWISDAYQRWIERRFLEPLKPLLRHPPEEPVSVSVRRLQPVYEPVLGTEAVLTMARIMELTEHGLAGAINVLPFSCMPGLIVTCLGPKVREEVEGLPWLDVAFDGQKETNLHTRLEAFMHQAHQFHLRRRVA